MLLFLSLPVTMESLWSLSDKNALIVPVGSGVFSDLPRS